MDRGTGGYHPPTQIRIGMARRLARERPATLAGGGGRPPRRPVASRASSSAISSNSGEIRWIGTRSTGPRSKHPAPPGSLRPVDFSRGVISTMSRNPYILLPPSSCRISMPVASFCAYDISKCSSRIALHVSISFMHFRDHLVVLIFASRLHQHYLPVNILLACS